MNSATILVSPPIAIPPVVPVPPVLRRRMLSEEVCELAGITKSLKVEHAVDHGVHRALVEHPGAVLPQLCRSFSVGERRVLGPTHEGATLRDDLDERTGRPGRAGLVGRKGGEVGDRARIRT